MGPIDQTEPSSFQSEMSQPPNEISLVEESSPPEVNPFPKDSFISNEEFTPKDIECQDANDESACDVEIAENPVFIENKESSEQENASDRLNENDNESNILNSDENVLVGSVSEESNLEYEPVNDEHKKEVEILSVEEMHCDDNQTLTTTAYIIEETEGFEEVEET